MKEVNILKPLVTGSSVLVVLLAGILPTRAASPKYIPQFQQYSVYTPQSLHPSKETLSFSQSPQLDSHYLSKYAATDAVPVLKVGSRGEVVEDVQKFLKQNGAYTGAIDGVFGSKLKEAVASFQQQTSLTPDGVIGIQTWRSMLSSQTG